MLLGRRSGRYLAFVNRAEDVNSPLWKSKGWLGHSEAVPQRSVFLGHRFAMPQPPFLFEPAPLPVCPSEPNTLQGDQHES